MLAKGERCVNICLLPEKYPPDPGGLAVSAQRLARGLAAHGHLVHVCLTSSSLPPKDTTHQPEGKLMVHRLGASRRTDDTLADWFDLVVGLHQKHNFELLHGHYLAQAGYVTVYAGRYLGLPTVVSARGNDLDRTLMNPTRAGGILWALENADGVTAVSQDLARKVLALSGGRAVRVIPNGVNSGLFQPAGRDAGLAEKLGLDRSPVIGFVGEGRLKKGLGVLLPAFAQVALHQPVQLLLVGGVRPDDADLVQVFKRKSPRLPVLVTNKVALEELPAYYNLIDVLALPSLRDGMPNALLEGMACGRAVVASAVGGIPDVVDDGENGILVSPGDTDALSTALIDLLGAPEKSQSLGAAARRTAEGHFTPERELEANLALYQQLIGPS